MPKADRAAFLSRNPFPRPQTLGFFYREKMRAIHRIAPELDNARILELGGGRSGLSAMLYPDAEVLNVDIDESLGSAACNRGPRTSFVCADCTHLPIASNSVDLVTAFDLLEHVPDDRGVVAEAFRVLRVGGAMLVTTPNEHWRYPYHHAMKRICPPDTQLMADWGHVRRGYSVSELVTLFEMEPVAQSTFINPLTVISHDIAFSDLPNPVKQALCVCLLPVTRIGYALHQNGTRGTESATLWMVPTDVDR